MFDYVSVGCVIRYPFKSLLSQWDKYCTVESLFVAQSLNPVCDTKETPFVKVTLICRKLSSRSVYASMDSCLERMNILVLAHAATSLVSQVTPDTSYNDN